MKLRTFIVPALLPLSLLIASGCAKPRELNEVDPHLKAAAELIDSNPDKALLELDQASKAPAVDVARLRGVIFEKLKKLDKAAAAYSEALKLKPNQHELRASLARVQLLTEALPEARTNLQTVVEKDPSHLVSIILLALSAPQEAGTKQAQAALALKALRAWPDTRVKPKADQPAVPLYAEYLLALVAFEDDETRREKARSQARLSKFGSLEVALTLVHYALVLQQPSYASELLHKLVSAELQPDQLERVARWSLALKQTRTAGQALNRLPGNLRSANILELRARHALATRSFQQAVSLARSAKKATDKKDTARLDKLSLLLATAHLGLKQHQEAAAQLDELLKRAPESRKAQLLYAELELRQGQKEGAVARLVALVEKSPKDSIVHAALARAELSNGNLTKSEKTYRRLIELSPQSTSALLELLKVLRLQKKEKDSLLALQKGLKRIPHQISLLRELAGQHLRMKSPESALAAVNDAKSWPTQQVEVALLLADTYSTLGRKEEVRTTLQALVKSEPTSARAWSALARSQQQEGDLKGMEQSLRKSLKINPRGTKDRARLATLLMKRGDDEEAAKLFTDLSNASGKDFIALNNAALLYAGSLNDPKRAVEFAEKAYKLAPDHPSVRDTLGWCLAKRGTRDDLKRAEKLLSDASAKLASPESAFHYAYLLIKIGKQSEGKKLLQKILKAPGDDEWREEAKSLLN